MNDKRPEALITGCRHHYHAIKKRGAIWVVSKVTAEGQRLWRQSFLPEAAEVYAGAFPEEWAIG